MLIVQQLPEEHHYHRCLFSISEAPFSPISSFYTSTKKINSKARLKLILRTLLRHLSINSSIPIFSSSTQWHQMGDVWHKWCLSGCSRVWRRKNCTNSEKILLSFMADFLSDVKHLVPVVSCFVDGHPFWWPHHKNQNDHRFYMKWKRCSFFLSTTKWHRSSS